MPELPDRNDTCLFLDVDGTLLDIAFRPADVVVQPDLIETLEQTNHILRGAVALVSGRMVAEIDRLFAPLMLRTAGVHGAEQRFEPQGPIVRSDRELIADDIVEGLRDIALRIPGVAVENKRYAVALHYRAVPGAADELAASIRDFLTHYSGLTLLPGHFVFEIKPPTDNKGEAVLRFLKNKTFAGRSPIFVGDDTTDLFGFAAAVANHGQAYSVGRDMPGVTGSFESPSAVRGWLADFVKKSLVTS